MIEILLACSVIVNVLLIWYITQLLRRFLSFQEDLDEFAIKLEEYEEHINIINGLERFYGDETIADLLRHSKNMVAHCKQFQNILLDEEEEYGEEEE